MENFKKGDIVRTKKIYSDGVHKAPIQDIKIINNKMVAIICGQEYPLSELSLLRSIIK